MGGGAHFTFLVGGKAGHGVKKAGSTASRMFADMGLNVFEMDDYQSLIRGGHNFSVVSASKDVITSHYMRADLVVSLDARSHEMHRGHATERGILVFNSDDVRGAEGLGIPLKTEAGRFPEHEMRLGVSAVAVLAAAVGLSREQMRAFIGREYPGDRENNVAYASAVYDLALPHLGARFALERGEGRRTILSGNEALALGAAAGGLDMYFAYPMTPSSSLLHFLAARDRQLGVIVVHPENELAVVNMAIGAAFAGARVMVGSSGGGFALMQEAFSLAGMTETPLLCVLGSRPGPSTGVPTYTEQGDLGFALNQGHGEFPRIVASPGTIGEAYRLAAEMLALVWRFQTPGIILTDKHMAESSMTVELDLKESEWSEPKMHGGGAYKRYLDVEDGISPLLFPPSKELIKWDSYEHDENGITTEDPELIARMHDKRMRKRKAVVEHLKTMRTVNIFGDEGPVIFTYGSTTMSVLEALRASEIKAKVVQPIYLEPLPTWELGAYETARPIVVEMSAAGQFASLLECRAGVEPRAVIRKYDGRPFDPLELAERIEEVA